MGPIERGWREGGSLLHVASVGHATAKKLTRCFAGQLPKIAIEMGLVVVPGAMGQLGPADLVLSVEPADQTMEADDACQRLGREADLLPEGRDQPSRAPTQLLGQRADARIVIGEL